MRIQHADGSEELHEGVTAKFVLESTEEALQDDTVTEIKTHKEKPKRASYVVTGTSEKRKARRRRAFAKGLVQCQK